MFQFVKPDLFILDLTISVLAKIEANIHLVGIQTDFIRLNMITK